MIDGRPPMDYGMFNTVCLTTLFTLLIAALTSGEKVYAADTNYANGVKLFNERRYGEALRYLNESMKSGKTASNLYYAALSKVYLTDTAGATVLMREIQSGFPHSPEAANATQFLSRPVAAPAPTSSAAVVTTQKSAERESPDDVASLPEQVSIPFRRGVGGHLLVEGQLNGRPMPMIFDTGAEGCVFGQNHLDAAGISQKGKAVGYATGVGGNVKITELNAEVSAGSLKRKLPIMIQARLEAPPLLGETFFAGYTYAIDNRAGIIRFNKKGAGKSTNGIGFDTIEVPYTPAGKNMLVTIEIEGRPIQACFDTGASGVVLGMNDAAALGLRIPEDSGWGASAGIGGQVTTARFNVRSIKMGAIQKSNFPINVLMSGLPYPLVGQTFFGDRKFTIDQEHRVIHFSR